MTLHVARLSGQWFVLNDAGTPQSEGFKRKGDAQAALYRLKIKEWRDIV